jgi:hypothetical protein
MHTNSKGTELVNPEASHSAVTPAAPSNDPTERARMSDIGRALAARGSDQFVSELDVMRAAAIRDRVLTGAYDAAEVVDAVARRLLATGDC